MNRPFKSPFTTIANPPSPPTLHNLGDLVTLPVSVGARSALEWRLRTNRQVQTAEAKAQAARLERSLERSAELTKSKAIKMQLELSSALFGKPNTSVNISESEHASHTFENCQTFF